MAVEKRSLAGLQGQFRRGGGRRCSGRQACRNKKGALLRAPQETHFDTCQIAKVSRESIVHRKSSDDPATRLGQQQGNGNSKNKCAAGGNLETNGAQILGLLGFGQERGEIIGRKALQFGARRISLQLAFERYQLQEGGVAYARAVILQTGHQRASLHGVGETLCIAVELAESPVVGHQPRTQRQFLQPQAEDAFEDLCRGAQILIDGTPRIGNVGLAHKNKIEPEHSREQKHDEQQQPIAKLGDTHQR